MAVEPRKARSVLAVIPDELYREIYRVGQWLNWGEVFYVDPEHGSATGSGKTPGEALNTINLAVAKCLDDRGDVIVFKSRLTGGNQFDAQQVIDKRGVKLLGGGLFRGMGRGFPSCFVTPHTCGSILAGDAHDFYCGLVLGADGIEVAGIKFYNPDATQAQFHIGLLDNQGNARNCSIHDCVLQGQMSGLADRTRGIKAVGIETLHVFRNLLYSCEHGVEIEGGSKRFSSQCVIEDNLIACAKYGIHFPTGGGIVENWILRNKIMPKKNYGYTITNGILVGALANGNFFGENYVGHDTKLTCYTDNGTDNIWLKNYYGKTGPHTEYPT